MSNRRRWRKKLLCLSKILEAQHDYFRNNIHLIFPKFPKGYWIKLIITMINNNGFYSANSQCLSTPPYICARSFDHSQRNAFPTFVDSNFIWSSERQKYLLYCKFWLVEHTPLTHLNTRSKILNIIRCSNSNQCSSLFYSFKVSRIGLSKEDIKKEVEILSSCRHDNIIMLHHNFQIGSEIVLVLEL